MYLFQKDSNFKQAFNSAEYIIPDGISVVYAAKILKNKRINKIRVNLNFFRNLQNRFAANQTRIFLLGSQKHILAQAIDKLKKLNFNLVGWNDGYEISDDLIDKINKTRPDVLIVGMGMPKQELWISQNFNKIDCPVFLAVGDLIDIIAGKSKIAPAWLTKTPFEWLFRAINEPIRLLPRYIKCQPYFIYLLLKSLFSNNRK